MGLASFNRMRRSMAEANRLEAERSDKNNKARWDAHHARNAASTTSEAEYERLAEAENAGRQEVGRKNEEGIERGDDLPLRKDHAAEIAGRSPHSDPQQPKSQVERLAERVPMDETANERLTEAVSLGEKGEGTGPTEELVEEAQREVVGLSGVENFDESGTKPAEGEEVREVPADQTGSVPEGEQSGEGEGDRTVSSGDGSVSTNLDTGETTFSTADDAQATEGDGAQAGADASGEGSTADAQGTAAESGSTEGDAGKADAVDIPDNWRELSAADRREIADKLVSEPVKNGDVANDVIREELARRDK